MTAPSGHSGPGSTPGRASARSPPAWRARASTSSSLGTTRRAGDVLHDGDGALSHECDGHRVGTDAVAGGAAGGVGGATTGQPRWLGGSSFVIPDLETSDVQLKGSPAKVHRDPFHQHLVLREDRVA